MNQKHNSNYAKNSQGKNEGNCKIVRPHHKFFIAPNEVIKNPNISLLGKNILLLLFSMPDDWRFRPLQFQQYTNKGKNAIYKAINQLIELGYLHRERARDNGDFAGFEYQVYDCPENNPHFTNNHIPNSHLPKKQKCEKGNVTNIEYTNTDYTNKDINNNIVCFDDDYDEFYELYPRKGQRQLGKTLYVNIRKCGDSKQKLLDALHRYKKYLEYQKVDNKFIKLVSTFLNQKNKFWEEEWCVQGLESQKIGNLDNMDYKNGWDV